jgi:transposase
MLGIDVSKDTLACSLRDDQSKVELWHGTVPNSEAGLRQLCRRIPAACPWVMEPTGRYSSLAVRFGQQQGRRVLQAPPRRAKTFLASVQTRAKADRVDAAGLSLFGLAHLLRPFPERNARVERLQELLRARRGLGKAMVSLQLQLAALPAAAEPLQRAIAALRQEQQVLDQEIATLTDDAAAFPQVARLEAVPGIGRLTAATVAACLQQKDFHHPDQFVAFVGLDVAVRQSGKRSGDVGLTREGDAELRRLLYLAALANVRCSQSPFKALYEKHRAKGLPTTGAACAVARKLAKVCWSLCKHGTTYDAARVTQQAKRPPQPGKRPPQPSPGS